MNPPLISIIVPVYNVEQYLDECVESLVQQTYQNLEIILVDDGSLDCSPQKCDDWVQKDPRIKVIHKPNGGLSDARNTGIDASSGKYIMFVDSDDFIAKKAVQGLYDLLVSTDADIACGGVYNYSGGNSRPVYNRSITQKSITFSGIDQLKNILNSTTDCAAWNKLFRRSIISGHRFIKGRYNEDVIFLAMLYPKCNNVAYTSNRYYYYRNTPGSVTNSLSSRTMDALKNALEMAEFFRDNRIPVGNEMRNYQCRTCLELGYAIQREKAQKRFPQETAFSKKHIASHIGYMMSSKHYNWRDLIHAAICLLKL